MSKKLAKSTLTFSAMTLISRILGFLRDMVVAHIFGATAQTDAFYVAFKIPNFMRRLFAEGAFSQAFIPLLAEYKEKRTQEEMKLFIHYVSGTLAGVLILFTLAAILAAPWIIDVFSPGFIHDPLRYSLATEMLRITFPYVLFISLTAFAGGILNTQSHFAGPALTPIWLNIVMIIAAIWGSRYFSTPIIGLAWGVFFAGIIQLLFQYPFLKHFNLVPKFKWGWNHPGVQRVLKLMLPALFGVSVSQIGLLISTAFASFLQQGSITWLYNSERLIEFPLGIFGVAISTVILPHLSKNHANKSTEEYSATLEWAIRCVLLIGIPSAIGLIMLSGSLMTSMFNYGKYNEFDVLMSQRSLIAYSIGVPFMMLVKILASGFYGRQNIKTPVKVAAFVLVLNMVMNFILMRPLQHAGIALAASISAFSNCAILFFWLVHSKIFTHHKGWFSFLGRLLIANGLVTAFLYYFNPGIHRWFEWHALDRFTVLFALVIGASLIYVASLWAMRFKLREIKGAA